LIGGWDEKETQDKIFRYDPQTQETSFVGYLPYKIEGHSVSVIDDQMFVIGGFDSFGVSDKITQIDLKTWSCTVLPLTLRFKRENQTSQVLNGETLVVAGGWSDGKSMS
jgi:N-acetylneuraminic acid mutarotase